MVPPAGLADGTEVGACVVSRHHRRASGHDLAHLARGHLAAIGVDDAHLHHRRGATGVALGRAPDSVEGQHPHDLGLPVAGRLPGPGAGVHRHHVVPLRLAPEGPQGLEVVAALLIGVDDLVHGRAHDEGARAPLAFDQPADLLGVDPAGEDVGAREMEGGQRGHERGHVKERARVEVHVVRADLLQVGHDQVLEDDGRVAQEGTVGPAREGCGVELQDRGAGIDLDAGVLGRSRCQEGLVAPRSLVVVAQPEGVPTGLLPGLADGFADLVLLPDDHRGLDVLQDEGQLLGRLTPVDGTEHGACLGRGQDPLEHAVAVLSQPQDALA